MHYKTLLVVTLLFLTFGCTATKKERIFSSGEPVDFGNVQSYRCSDVIEIERFLPLETTEESLFGGIDQVEIWNGKIYLLDSYKTNTVFVFSLEDGKYLDKLKCFGTGPGEFTSPHAFWIDKSDSTLYVLDRMLSKLLKYDAADFSYRGEVQMPDLGPLAFAVLPDSQYMYYYPLRSNNRFGGKQCVLADKDGQVLGSYYPAPASGKILHGNPAAFYLCDGRLRFCPYFSSQVYELAGDSLQGCYSLGWGDAAMPEERMFERHVDSSETMKEILTNDYIRLLYVYENSSSLAVKYYIKRDFYLSVLNKDTRRLMNMKASEVTDDMGIGGTFPLPYYAAEDGRFVGCLFGTDMTVDVTAPDLKAVMGQTDCNPVLVFYRFKG